ncbi:hypothetical protein ACFL5O_02385 [Myxococcota bacterium]
MKHAVQSKKAGDPWGMRPRSLMPAVGVFLGIWLAAGPVQSQAKKRVITISEVTIVGRVQKPIAAVDVSRIQPKLTLGELKQPFVQRIESTIYRTPF